MAGDDRGHCYRLTISERCDIINVDVNSILIVMDGDISAMVKLTPCLRALKTMKPNLNITVYGERPALSVVAGTPYVDRAITASEKVSYNVGFVLRDMEQSRQMQKLMDSCSEVYQIAGADDEEEFVTYMQPAVILGYTGYVPEPFCAMTEAALTDGVFVGMAYELAEARKHWPYYAELSRWLSEKGYRSVVFGDRAVGEAFDAAEWAEGTLCMAGYFHLKEIAGWMHECAVVLADDYWGAFLARAAGASVLHLAGSTYTKRNHFFQGEYGGYSESIHTELECLPCVGTPEWDRCDSYRCMTGITAEYVLDKIEEVIQKQNNGGATDADQEDSSDDNDNERPDTGQGDAELPVS